MGANDLPPADLARRHGVSEVTIYPRKSKCGGLDVSEARLSKALDSENARRKRLVADAMLVCVKSDSSSPTNVGGPVIADCTSCCAVRGSCSTERRPRGSKWRKTWRSGDDRCRHQGTGSVAGSAEPVPEPRLRSPPDGAGSPVTRSQGRRKYDKGVHGSGAGHVDLWSPCRSRVDRADRPAGQAWHDCQRQRH